MFRELGMARSWVSQGAIGTLKKTASVISDGKTPNIEPKLPEFPGRKFRDFDYGDRFGEVKTFLSNNADEWAKRLGSQGKRHSNNLVEAVFEMAEGLNPKTMDLADVQAVMSNPTYSDYFKGVLVTIYKKPNVGTNADLATDCGDAFRDGMVKSFLAKFPEVKGDKRETLKREIEAKFNNCAAEFIDL